MKCTIQHIYLFTKAVIVLSTSANDFGGKKTLANEIIRLSINFRMT